MRMNNSFDRSSDCVIGDDADFGTKLQSYVDWTGLPCDTVLDLFTRLNYHDRASLASTCSKWRNLGASSYLWSSLDTRLYQFNPSIAASLAPRCAYLKKLRFRHGESAEAIVHLQAKHLVELSGEYCRKVTDATLSMIAARHDALECLELGPDFCENITSEAIKIVAFCCQKLRKLHLSGLKDVSSEAVECLAKYCTQLSDLGFLDCFKIDEEALGKVVSVRYLSVAGTSIDWNVATENWKRLPNLIGLDVSRTDIDKTAVSRLLESSSSLEVLCALFCDSLESFSSNRVRGKVLLAPFTDIFDELASIFADDSKKPKDVFSYWRGVISKDKCIDEKMRWIEWSISHTLQRCSESIIPGFDDFWVSQGAKLLLSLLQSSQEDVQEKAVKTLATFIVNDDDDTASLDFERVEAVIRGGGIRILLQLAKSSQDAIQSETAKAIGHLSSNANVAKTVAEQGWISVLIGLTKSTTKLVAEEATGGLWNLSVVEENKYAIAQAGGVKALVELIYRWTIAYGVIVVPNLSTNRKCSEEVVRAGGVHALVILARDSEHDGANEQASRALRNISAYRNSNNNITIIGQVPGAIEALVKLTKSILDSVKLETAGALWNLSFDEKNRESIAAVGGVEALVALANSCSDASTGVQQRVAGALWGLAASQANSIAIGDEGGIPPLLALAQSEVGDVQETAAGALWNLSFHPSNALRIVEEGGVMALADICSSSQSKLARFISVLALAYIFDGRMDEMIKTTSESTSKSFIADCKSKAFRSIEAFIRTFMEPVIFAPAALSFAPPMLAKYSAKVRIHEAGHLKCTAAEIGRFVTMLRNQCGTLRSCAAFALLQFTLPKGRHVRHHTSLMQNAGGARVLRSTAAAYNLSREAKIYLKIVLNNLENHTSEAKAENQAHAA
ncbi:unnamed protein product [Arabis nemorensis]|uniref:F-box domain-containing protein n=1 Tax=Arabis nemorensis TaxID=586526 RepID=A0A565BY95_9BRAS|nr:unnamed protein product [Arabis nemorensis]